MTSTTTTVLVIHRNSNDPDSSSYCTGMRSHDSDIYPNQWCVPGGFLNAKYKPAGLPGEDALIAAKREVKEETGIDIDVKDLVLFGQNSDPDLDPRAHITNLWFWVEVNDAQRSQAQAGDDLQELGWNWVGSVRTGLAFNHDEILQSGLDHWRNSHTARQAIQVLEQRKVQRIEPTLTLNSQGRVALAVMRGQMFHKGHGYILNRMVEDYDTVILGIGSQNTKRTKSNPWTGEERLQMIRNIYGNRIKIVQLSDLGTEQGSNDWIEYVLKKTAGMGLPAPTDYFTGSHADSVWYKNRFWDGPENAGALQGPSAEKFFVDMNGVRTLRRLHIIDRNQNAIPPATDLRTFLETRNDGWKAYVPGVNHRLVEDNYPEEFRVREAR
jgi:ADP-ribose pyrophosphatase YjhB (NUDIX family)